MSTKKNKQPISAPSLADLENEAPAVDSGFDVPETAQPPGKVHQAPHEPVLFSARIRIEKEVIAWIEKANCPAIPINVITALDALGYLTPRQTINITAE